ncbi:MAG: glycosyltransferase family 2 protein [Crocinitomicaceae bacterium]|nr:glycosyltransferase family 2 protein [Crocinitomicaceae bacterium]
MKNSNVAIVILNWNGQKFIEQFLPSVIQHSGDARVIIADNASTDRSIEFLKDQFPSVEIIQNESNGGFAKGYNDALKKVNSEFYLLLNSDVEVTENWLDELLLPMVDPKVAGCQPKVLSYHKKTHFEHAGASGGFIDKNYFPFCRGRMLTEAEEDFGQYNNSRDVFWTTGACMIIRSSLYHEVSGFDEDFFAHMEEIDLCWRLKRRGFKFKVAPKSVVYHVGGGTLPYSSPRKTFLNFRNNLFMITKNHQGLLLPKILMRLFIDGVAAMLFLLKGKFKQFGAIFKAHMAFYGKLRMFISKRKKEKTPKEIADLSGYFKGSILWNFYFKGIKKSSILNQRLFK